jgi:hypothetical protein
MDRTQRLLAAVLAVQLLVIGLLQFVFPASGGAVKEQPLLPALASMTPEKIEVGDGTGRTITLAREGGAWTLEDPKGYPTSAGKVEKLIDDMEKLSVGRPMVSNRRNHAALKVADDGFERRIRIWEKASDKPSAELYVGTSSRFQSSHVRVGGKDPVYEASGINAYDVASDAASWIERNLVPLAADSVTAVAVRNRKGSFELEKRDGRWSVRAPAARAGARLDAQKVEDLVRALCGTYIEAPAGPVDAAAQGLGAPDATVSLTGPAAAAAGAPVSLLGGSGAPPVPVVVSIGGPVAGKDGQRYATRSGFGFAVTVPKYSADRALDATLSELIAK